MTVVMCIQFGLLTLEAAKPDLHDDSNRHHTHQTDATIALDDHDTHSHTDDCDQCSHCHHGSHKLLVRQECVLFMPAVHEPPLLMSSFILPTPASSIYRPPIA